MVTSNQASNSNPTPRGPHATTSNSNSTESNEVSTANPAPAWRQFSFYDANPVRDSQDFSKPPLALRSVHEVAAVVSCPIQPLINNINNINDSDSASTSTSQNQAFPGRDASQSNNTITSGNKSSASHLSKPSILVGDISGRISVLEPERYSELASWSAYPLSTPSNGGGGRITHVTSDSRGRIVTLGEEDNIKFPILRIWDMRINGHPNRLHGEWSPRLLGEGKVQHGSRPHPVAALAHTPSLSYLSVGLADGTVLLLRGLDSALMSAPPNSTSSTIPAVPLPKFKVVFEPTSSSSDSSTNQTSHEPITALGFSEVSPTSQRTPAEISKLSKSSKNPPNAVKKTSSGGRTITNVKDAIQPPSKAASSTPTSVHLFIVTLSRILRYTVHGKGAGSAPTVVDDVGCALGCAAIVPSFSSLAASWSTAGDASNLASQGALSGKMVLAREEAIYVVGAEGREACFAFEGAKSSVRLSSSHLVIVSPPIAATAASTSATVRNFVADRDRGQRNRAGDLGMSGSGASSPARGSTASSSSPSNHPAFMSNGNARRMQNHQGRPSEIAKVSIFDLDNKLVAYSGAFERGVRDAWIGPSGEVCILGDDGALMRLDEKPLPQQLSLLFRRSLFLLAVNLAKSHATRAGTPEAAARVETLLGDIFRRYGDHLYSKGDFEGAMTQFIKTIGFTPPSYVIRKFLDAQRINNLTSYLHELHARGLANSDHTTLLLNCYTKLKDVASLNRFIKRPMTLSSNEEKEEDLLDPLLDEDDTTIGGKSGRDELPFDLETAMRVCRQAGYYSHAAYLARRYEEHDEYIRIQIEDARDFSDALLYLRSLSPEEAEANLLRYGKTLLNELPDHTTDLLIELCSGNFKPIPVGSTNLNGDGKEARNQDSTQGKSAAAAFLASLQVGGYSKNVHDSNKPNSDTPYSIEGARGSVSALNSSNHDSTSAEEDKSKPPGAQEPGYLTPSPTIFFPHFIRHYPQFVRFLSSVAEIKWGQRIQSREEHQKITSIQNGHQKSSRNGRISHEAEAENEEDEAERVLRELGLTPSNDFSQDDDGDSERRDQKAVWNTLLELYLRSPTSISNSASTGPSGSPSDNRLSVVETNPNGTLELSRQGQRERALRLLEQHDTLPFDQTHALVLCSMEKFTEGIILLYEQMGMFEEILRFWMDSSLDELSGETIAPNKSKASKINGNNKNSSSCKVMETLRLYGKENPHLYPITLRYLVSEDRILSRHQNDLKSVLNHIEDEGLMSPLEVVQALSRTGVANVGLVRDYLTRAIETEREEIDGDRRLIASYRTETAKKQKEVSDLSSPDVPRVFQINRCTSCGGQLDLPSVHFMCKHSFHQRCLGENEIECPECARSYGVIREIRRGNEQLVDRQDLFLQEVSEGGFDTVTSMFSKGIIRS